MEKETFIVINEQKDTVFDLPVDKFSYNRWQESMYTVSSDREVHNQELRESVNDLYRQLTEMLYSLTPLARERMMLFLRGESQVDIAKRYNVNRAAINKHIKQCMNQLKWEDEHLPTLRMIFAYGEIYIE